MMMVCVKKTKGQGSGPKRGGMNYKKASLGSRSICICSENRTLLRRNIAREKERPGSRRRVGRLDVQSLEQESSRGPLTFTALERRSIRELYCI